MHRCKHAAAAKHFIRVRRATELRNSSNQRQDGKVGDLRGVLLWGGGVGRGCGLIFTASDVLFKGNEKDLTRCEDSLDSRSRLLTVKCKQTGCHQTSNSHTGKKNLLNRWGKWDIGKFWYTNLMYEWFFLYADWILLLCQDFSVNTVAVQGNYWKIKVAYAFPNRALWHLLRPNVTSQMESLVSTEDLRPSRKEIW